jgi:glycosyltransferase involved in cell wall biosynthesis
MNIGIDATLLREDRITGVERYIINLVRYVALQNRSYHIYVFFKNILYHDLVLYADKFTPIIIKSNNRIIVDQVLIPFYARKYKIDLMHFPVFGAPVLYRKKSVLTIHDATFWLYPETISIGGRFYYKLLFKQSIKRAKQIITVSESSRNDLIQIFNLNPAKITAIYEAVDDVFLRGKSDEEYALSKYLQYRNQYILSVGTIEPRKNLATLLKAFKIIKKRHGNIKLLLTGRNGWNNQLHIPNEIKDDIIFTGFIEDKLLPEIYRNALVYVFPSIYEGFGFPILEAFACGTAVVASDTSSLPEIGDEACLYAKFDSPQDFAHQIEEIIINNDKREELIENGYKRLKDFSWDKCAKETMGIYALAIDNND